MVSGEDQVAVLGNNDTELMSLGSDVKNTKNISSESFIQDAEAVFAKAAGAPWVEIIENTTSQPIRFRYNSENRFSPVPGARSTPEHPTYLTIKIHNYIGPSIIQATCVTKHYMVHPNKLEGENCDKKGVYSVNRSVDEQNNEFQIKVGIVRMTHKEIDKSLKDRGSIDPFSRGNRHDLRKKFDTTTVRIAIEVQLWNEENKPCVFRPVASGVVYDKCHELVIQHTSAQQGYVYDGFHLYLFCKHIRESDLVEFYREPCANCAGWSWEVKPMLVHQNVAAYVVTPYYNPPMDTLHGDELLRVTNVEMKCRLKRKVDKKIVHYSEPWTFYYIINTQDLMQPPPTPIDGSTLATNMRPGNPRRESSVAGPSHVTHTKHYGQGPLPSTATRSPSFNMNRPCHTTPRSNPQPSPAPSYTDTADSQQSMSSYPWSQNSPPVFPTNQSPNYPYHSHRSKTPFSSASSSCYQASQSAIMMQYPICSNQGQETEQLPSLFQTELGPYSQQNEPCLVQKPSELPPNNRNRYSNGSMNGQYHCPQEFIKKCKRYFRRPCSDEAPMSLERPVKQSSPPAPDTNPPLSQQPVNQPDNDNMNSLSDEFRRIGLKIIQRTRRR